MKRFALDIVNFWESLPKDDTCKTLSRQSLRSGASVAANYRAVCRAKSKPDFISKFGIVLEEANELIAIAISSINTARKNQ